MKKSANPSLNRQILEEASDWFVDFRVGDVDANARERFDEWLRRSPEHIRAYWEIAKTYVELPALTPPDKINIGELIAYAHSGDNVVSLHGGTPIEAPKEWGSQARESRVSSVARAPRRRFLAAASIAFALAISGAVYWQAHRYPLYATDIGERRSITLADGSTVDLNARSQLRVEFSKTERRVELLDGQALFQVAKDKSRPFIVHSGEALVRAVGTQFDVYRKDTGTTVTVLEGRVAVYSTAHADQTTAAPGPTASANAALPHHPPRASTRDSSSRSVSADSSGSAAHIDATVSHSGLSDPSGSGAILLSAGEQVTVTPDAAGTAVPQHADITAATAWMQRKLIFEGSRLSDVVSEFNRYNRKQLVIEDPKLADFQISGAYSSTDPSSLLRFLEDQGVVVSEGENEVRFNRK